MKILFVCTANICRSVMAEGVMKKLLSAHAGIPMVSVSSAGVDALEGSTPDRYTIEVCDKRGIAVGLHSARQLTREMLEEMDFILCMEKMHRERIAGAFPQFARNIFLLKEYMAGDPPVDAEIGDPIGRSKKHFEKCFNSIEAEIMRIAPLILTNTMK
jgi:protein-tyrosine-phosphatase